MKAKSRLLFQVHENINKNGEKYFSVDWAPEFYPILDEVSPNGEVTDRIIDIVEELLTPDEVQADTD